MWCPLVLDGVAVDSDASDVGLTSASASVKETIDAELALEQQWSE